MLGFLEIIAGIFFVVFMSVKIISDYGKTFWSFVDWVKKKWKEYRSLDDLKQIYLFVASVVLACLLVLFFNLLDDVLGVLTNKDESAVRDTAIAFLGTVSGIGALFGVYLAILRSEENKRQNDTAEQGLITDRINKAVESLGKINSKDEPVREVRLGALFALERIAQDSLPDHIRIMKILCAYIRINNSLANSTGSDEKPVKEDIRAALIIIGGRGDWTKNQEHLKEEEKQGYRLDLRNCHLQNADVSDADLSNACLIVADLQNSFLNDVNFTDATIIKVNLNGATLKRTDFKNAETDGTFAYKADFSSCKNLTQEQLDVMYCGIEVENLPEGLKRPKHWPKDKLSWNDFVKGYTEWVDKEYPDLF